MWKTLFIHRLFSNQIAFPEQFIKGSNNRCYESLVYVLIK